MEIDKLINRWKYANTNGKLHIQYKILNINIGKYDFLHDDQNISKQLFFSIALLAVKKVCMKPINL